MDKSGRYSPQGIACSCRYELSKIRRELSEHPCVLVDLFLFANHARFWVELKRSATKLGSELWCAPLLDVQPARQKTHRLLVLFKKDFLTRSSYLKGGFDQMGFLKNTQPRV